jgi:mono/diheme cytochrome c family protein
MCRAAALTTPGARHTIGLRCHEQSRFCGVFFFKKKTSRGEDVLRAEKVYHGGRAMRVRHRIGWLLFVLWGAVTVPTIVAAQGAGGAARAKPGVPQTLQQRSGEALFYQNCTLCHVYSAQKKNIGIQAPTELIGLFKDPAIDEAAVKQLLMQGIPGKMPSFRYNFEPREIDDVVAYLKIR